MLPSQAGLCRALLVSSTQYIPSGILPSCLSHPSRCSARLLSAFRHQTRLHTRVSYATDCALHHRKHTPPRDLSSSLPHQSFRSKTLPKLSDLRRQKHRRPARVSPYSTDAAAHHRNHFETRILPFTPRQLYDVVADVDAYAQFVPWCTSSKVLHTIDPNHLVAELAVGFQLLSENYTSLVTLEPYRSVKADVPHSSLFNYLINDWTFVPGKDQSTTELSFYVEFQFRNPLYQRITDLFFNEVVKNMVNAFEKRAFAKYSNDRPHIELH